MPYAPGITYDTTSLANGIAGAGQSVAQGIREYSINQAKDKEAEGIVAGLLQSNPDILQGADPKTAKLLEKFKNGDTGLKDNIFLAGWAQMTQKGLEKKQEMEAQSMQLQQMKAQAAQQAAARQFLSQAAQAQGGATGPLSNEAYKQFTSPLAQDAVALSKFSGGLPSQEVLARMQDTRETNAAKAGKGDKNNPQEVTLPSGAKVAFSPSTGAFSVLPQTPEQLAKAEGAKQEAELSTKGATTLINDITDSAENARHTVASVDRILSLYDQGVASGFGQPTLTQARAAFARFGLGGDGLANQQQFEKELNNLVLERGKELMKGSGAVSNYERQAIEKATANPTMVEGANKQILAVMKNIGLRTIKLDELRSKLEDQGASSVEIGKQIRKARDSMPVGIETILDRQEKPTSAKTDSATPAPAWTADKERRLQELKAKLKK